MLAALIPKITLKNNNKKKNDLNKKFKSFFWFLIKNIL
jgi:hypothetical protein